MHRIDTATKSVDLFGAGKHGFKDGNKALGIAATDLNASFFNAVQEELAYVIEQAGISLSGGDNTQLRQALQAMITGAGAIKTPVRAATTANIATLAGGAPSTLDGVTLVANDRILVKDQTTGSQNGLYVVTTLGTGANGTWTRTTDADGTGELVAGMLIVVQEGTTNADSVWELSTDGAITIGTTSLTFVRKDVATAKQIQAVSASVASNALTLNYAGGTLDFRNATQSNGTPNSGVVVAANSITVPSGATLGTVNGQQARLVLLEAYNGGSPVMCVANIAGGLQLDETNLISPTTISGTSNSNNVIYSASAVSASSPYRIVGFVDVTETTAGTWATAPTVVQGIGGQALAALSSVGYGQTWQSVTRTSGTTYYNTTGKPIQISVDVSAATATSTLTIGGQLIATTNVSNIRTQLSGVIPPGASYVIQDNGSNTHTTTELR